MPSTRSHGRAQPTLAFPRRKSCRVSSRSKTPQPEASPPPAESGPRVAPPMPPVAPPMPRVAPLVPRVTPPVPRLTPLSPGRPAVPPSSPRLQPRLPLSPRKRTGDDNGCNLDSVALESPPKQLKPSTNENSPLSVRRQLLVPASSPRKPLTPSASPRKPLTPSLSPRKQLPPSLSPRKPLTPSPRRQETPSGSPARRSTGVQLFPEKLRFVSVKRALHTAVPERLLSREAERASLRAFLGASALQGRPGSLYVSGAPGTGKTACLNAELQHMKAELSSVVTVVVNCMSLRSSHSVFPLLASRLKAPGGPSGLKDFLSAPGPPVLLVLDEMDQLDSKSQDVLYTVFEWPFLPKSRLCLIGIANSLDLTDRILPRLQARPHCRPRLLHFPPYSRDELTAIVQDRLRQASAEGILDSSAVQFCARKVSAVSGDARKALDICRRAVEVVESDERKKTAAQRTASEGAAPPRVGLPQVARVLEEVYGDRMASPGGGSDSESFPLQQKLLVCCLLLINRSSRDSVTLGKLHEVYRRVCSQRQVTSVFQAECLSLCSLLESRGIFSLKKAKDARLTKVCLKISERDVENALKDRTLLGSILQAGLPS